MRPVPKSPHWMAVLILVLASAASGWSAFLDRRCSEEQLRGLSAALRDGHDELYRHDVLLGPDGPWRSESPAVQTVLRGLYRLGGGGDDLFPARLLAGPVALLYLCGMYALLYWQTRSWSVSVFVAILSATVIHALGGSFWGVGSLASVTPAGVCGAFTPLIVLAYLRRQDSPGAWAVFGWIGLMGNLHSASAMNLAVVLLIAHLGQRRFARSAWWMALRCGVVALLGSLPILFYRFWVARQPAPDGGPASLSVVRQAFRLAEWDVLYPHLLRDVPTWLGFSAVLLVSSAVILSRGVRYPIRRFSLWVWCIAGALATTFLLHGASQLGGMLLLRRPPLIGLVRASSLLMLPLYVLLAQAITVLLRLVRPHRAAARWALAAFTLAWMAPSDNLRVARYAAADTATMFMDEQDKPRYVRKHHDRFQEWLETYHLAQWARSQTSPDAVFIGDLTEFRLRARRSLLASPDDVAPLYCHMPGRLGAWSALLTDQRRALSEASQGRSSLDELVRRLSVSARFGEVPEWYVLLRASDDAARHLAPVPAQGWGRFWVLCRVR